MKKLQRGDRVAAYGPSKHTAFEGRRTATVIRYVDGWVSVQVDGECQRYFKPYQLRKLKKVETVEFECEWEQRDETVDIVPVAAGLKLHKCLKTLVGKNTKVKVTVLK